MKSPKITDTTEPKLQLEALTIRNVAERLLDIKCTVHRLIVKGELNVIRKGCSIRITEAAQRTFLTGLPSHDTR